MACGIYIYIYVYIYTYIYTYANYQILIITQYDQYTVAILELLQTDHIV